ncbi:MAG TPA: DNA polymerase III subunit delta, partial [Candidatus Dormibacteraeota bacterium]|nr:DNA polymerase III subunit delta [Candidatus Dormibacteraeota bacterium]
GEERFLVEEKARALIADWRKDLVSDFGFEPMEAAGLTAPRLQDSVLQAPFLDPFRAVWVRGVVAARAEALAPALAEVPPTTRLLITVVGRLSAGNKLVKAVTAAGGRAEESARLKGRALGDWTARRAEELGLGRQVAAQVTRVTHADLGVIESELQKLAAYRASGAKLTPEVVSELLAGAREDEIFKLTDNLLPRPTTQAWAVARSLTRSGLQPTSIAYRMARHLALVLEVRARQDRGDSLTSIQADLPEHSFVVQKAFDAARDVDPDRLEAGLRAIRDYEFEVKSGQVDAELGLDVLLTRL